MSGRSEKDNIPPSSDGKVSDTQAHSEEIVATLLQEIIEKIAQGESSHKLIKVQASDGFHGDQMCSVETVVKRGSLIENCRDGDKKKTVSKLYQLLCCHRIKQQCDDNAADVGEKEIGPTEKAYETLLQATAKKIVEDAVKKAVLIVKASEDEMNKPLGIQSESPKKESKVKTFLRRVFTKLKRKETTCSEVHAKSQVYINKDPSLSIPKDAEAKKDSKFKQIWKRYVCACVRMANPMEDDVPKVKDRQSAVTIEPLSPSVFY